MKLALMLLIAAGCTDQLPDDQTKMVACDDFGYLYATTMTPQVWFGRKITSGDQCQVACFKPFGTGGTTVGAACDAVDPAQYGDVHCDVSYESGPPGSNPQRGCCVSGATAGPVDFAICN